MPTLDHEKGNRREQQTRDRALAATDDTDVRAYFADLERVDVLAAQESARLCQMAQAGDLDARNRCVEGNLRLVIFVARRFGLRPGVTFGDLIQEGNIGLMRAVEHFKPSSGVSFGTYAHRCILSCMMRYAGEASSSIHVPEYVRIHLRAEARGRTVNNPHVARLHPDARRSALRAAHVKSLDEEFEPEAQRNRNDPDAVTLGDTLADPDADTEGQAVARAEQAEVQRVLAVVFTGLSAKERMVLRLRFGLEGYDEHTLEAAGTVLGITRERVRQIEEKAILKLRERLDVLPDGSLILRRLLSRWRAA